MDDTARIDLHCHSAASFDGAVEPLRLIRVAAARGLTHVAITDHGTLAGALSAVAVGGHPLSIIVGQEVRTSEGDLIALFISTPIPSGLNPEQTVARIREQGGLVGMPHPFDVRRPSIGRGAGRPEQLKRLAALVDYVEVHNGRVVDDDANSRAAAFAQTYALPRVAVSDCHTEAEIGAASTSVVGRVRGPTDLKDAFRRGTSLHVRTNDRPAEPRRLGAMLRRLRREP